MHEFNEPLITAWQLVAGADARLADIVFLSLRVSLSATLIACVAGMPIGALLAVGRFPGRRTLIVLFNGLMGLPPVVVGLLVYLLLSRAGPLGQLGLLFSPAAMVIAQAILVTPIVAALTRQVIADEWTEYREQLRSLGASRTRSAAGTGTGLHPDSRGAVDQCGRLCVARLGGKALGVRTGFRGALLRAVRTGRLGKAGRGIENVERAVT